MQLRLLLTAIFIGLAVLQSRACPQGYESPESLVKRARTILEVEVLSTSDAPFPSTNGMSEMLLEELKFSNERPNAQAVVRVVKSLKGFTQAVRFNLIGGPYDTCAPGFNYLHFKTGERLYLILDHELPADISGVLVNWRCRALSANEKENGMKALIESARRSWRRQIEFHKSVAPEAYARAEAMSASSGILKPGHNLSKEPYRVLACLRILWMNPDALPALPLPSVKQATSSKDSMQNVFEAGDDPMAGQLVDHVYHTGQHGGALAPPILANVLEQKLRSEPREVSAFNQEMFRRFLIAELHLPENKAVEITRALGNTKAFTETCFNPYKCEVRDAAELKDLGYALGLADDEPDRLVWSTFGLRMSSDRGINPAYLTGYVEKNPDRDYVAWPRLIVLLSAPDPKTTAIVQKRLEKEQNLHRLDAYLAYFLKLNDYPQARKVLGKFAKLAVDDLQTARSEKDTSGARESLAYCVKKFRSLFDQYKCTDAKLLEELVRIEQQFAK